MQEKLTIHARLAARRQFGGHSRRFLNDAAEQHKNRGMTRSRENSPGRDLRRNQANSGEYGWAQHKFGKGEYRKALEMAAKYICNHLDGLCPMVVEQHPCPADCILETLPWHCWIDYFLTTGAAGGAVPEEKNPGVPSLPHTASGQLTGPEG
jgi:hypothetical protein